MPTVPRYDSPQVSPKPLPSIRTSPQASLEAFGGGPSQAAAGQALTDVVKGGLDIYQKEKQKADELAVLNADKQLSSLDNNLQYDPKIGALNKRGKDAFALPDQIKKDWDTGVEAIGKNLNNETQRMAFQKLTAARWKSLDESIQRHVFQETKNYDKSETDSYIANERTSAALNFLDQKRIDNSLARQKTAIFLYGQRNGYGKEQTSRLMAITESDTHMDVIDKMLGNGMVDRAEAYYNDHKNQIIGDDAFKFPEYFKNKRKEQETVNKAEKERFYDNNLRTAMLESFQGKLTLSELQRRYRNDELKDSDYTRMAHIVADPEFSFLRPGEITDPVSFNEIREAQLTAQKTPGEINQMILDAVEQGKLKRDPNSPLISDSEYLLGLTKELPPDPKDQQIAAQANSIRDFGNRYFTDSILGFEVNKEQKSRNVELLVKEFHKRVNAENAQGEKIDEIAHDVMRQFAAKRHPEISRLEDMPHVVIDVKGKIHRLLNPDQKTKLKPKYRLVPTGQESPEKKPTK